jgi:hypothetical protein
LHAAGTQKERYKGHKNHHAMTIKKRKGEKVGTMKLSHDKDDLDAEEMVLMQKGLYWMGSGVVDYKYYVLGAYAIICAVMFYQAASLQPSTEGPQLFIPDSNLGRAAALEKVFADFSATGGSTSDLPDLTSISELMANPSATDALNAVVFNCGEQFKAEAPFSVSIGGKTQSYMQCGGGQELKSSPSSIDCASTICTATECCEDSRQCKTYLQSVDTKLCTADSLYSKVKDDTQADITCAGSDGCTSADCCGELTCKLYFEANPAEIVAGFSFSLCDAGTFASTKDESTTCASSAECTKAECCAEFPTCLANAFETSSCAAKKHLISNPGGTKCALQDCTSADCCEDNDQCSTFFNAQAADICTSTGRVNVVGTTVCDTENCDVGSCCADLKCDIKFGLAPEEVCTAGTFHLKATADTINFDGTLDATCCDPNPVCTSFGSCPNLQHKEAGQAGIKCLGQTCAASDCCVDNEVCRAAAETGGVSTGNDLCATNTRIFDAAEELKPCAAAVCTHEDCCFENCGDQKATFCKTFTHADASANGGAGTCVGDPCLQTECCVDNTNCDGSTVCDALAKWSLKEDTTDRCAAETCDTGDCCELHPKCSTVKTCPIGTKNKGNSVRCGAKVCEEDPTANVASECCELLTCASETLGTFCDSTQDPKADSTRCETDTQCAKDECCTDQTEPFCKDFVGDVDAAFCGAGKALKEDNAIRCAQANCLDPGDVDTCCRVVTFPTCEAFMADPALGGSTFCADNNKADRQNLGLITCTDETCAPNNCCEAYKTCAEEDQTAFCRDQTKPMIFKANPANDDCVTGTCTGDNCCRVKVCNDDQGDITCDAGETMTKGTSECATLTCTADECCTANPTCASFTVDGCASGNILVEDRTTVCDAACNDAKCCELAPSEIPLEVVFDCDTATDAQILQAIELLKNQTAAETGLSTDQFTIELCNKEARQRRDEAGKTLVIRGHGILLRTRRANETATFTIKIDRSSVDQAGISNATSTLVDQENENPSPLDILKIDADTGQVALDGNIAASTTTTTTTTTTFVQGTIAPTEPIVLKPTTTKFAIGLVEPYVPLLFGCRLIVCALTIRC